ncbi:NACHT domain-containing protein [Picosynechococcus sp. PCC 73109]|uniref:NACHT domain-containing protein n=1 Tax=Picosynechococcus sp. PCC 73109 TaxID=374982 RepID=UPI0007458C02|nr:hypothetical protein [Picosynechococcus sp. PCC 73109]AMA10259.1 hypothetical protein AWQ23_13530 [Picosynechococcus sp. PCC 73109]
MPKKDYKWKRFWCPRSGTINLADGGYLCDPDGEWGRAHNPDLVSLEAIAEIPCLVLLGEPGIGKSQELENLKALTENNSSQVLELNLRSCTNLKEDLFKDETFTDWLGGNYHLYLFLDSLDEGLLSIPTLATALIDELRKPKYRNHINRLHLRLACRTFVFSEILEEGLKELWTEANFESYELAPLRCVDVSEAAKAEGFSSDNFLREIDQKDIVPLAIKPITLRFLLNTYRRHSCQFLSNQRLHELYLEGCKVLCEEVNESRHASDRTGNFDSDQRLIVAARIAAVTIFANRFAVWIGIDQGDIPAEDVLLQKLCFGFEKANGKKFEVTREAVREVLDTGLFSSRGSNRMGWAHQTYAEFLAAWYLTQHNIPLPQIKELIFSTEEADQKLIPQLHETAAWLASIRPDVFKEIITTDPYVLLQSDVPTDAKIRALIVNNLFRQYEEGKLFDKSIKNYHHYAKLKHSGLVEQLRPYICDASKQDDVRDLAIDIAEVCKVPELQDELAQLALDQSQSIHLRGSAAHAICIVGDATTRLKLKPLAIESLPEDENYRLKGYALRAIWSDHLTAEELFQALTPPKNINHMGGYRWFLNYELVPKLQTNDLVTALDWLKEQGHRHFWHPFEELGDAMLFKAWENFEFPGVVETFTQVALIQWRNQQRIISHDNERQKKFAISLLQESSKRRSLIEQAVLNLSRTEEEPDVLICFLRERENILLSDDIFWMLEKLQESNCEEVQKIWAQLIKQSFNYQDVGQIIEILEATISSDILKVILSNSIDAINISSAWANTLRNNYIRQNQMNPPLLEPPPKDQVLECLEKLEAGDLSAWRQLNMNLALKPDGTHCDSEFELDLTKFPGWQEAEEATRRRIIEGAKKYVQQYDDVDYSWIGTGTFNELTLANCRVFLLLLKESFDFLESLSPEIWQRWAPIIIASPGGQRNDSYLELVKNAYTKAPEEFIETLEALIDHENQKHSYLSVIDSLDKCWNEPLKEFLLEKAKHPLLKPKCMGQLLEKLLKQRIPKAKVFSESLITLPLPSTDNEREKVIIAARVLVENSDSSSWPFIWEYIQQNISFGRQVIESVADRYLASIQSR